MPSGVGGISRPIATTNQIPIGIAISLHFRPMETGIGRISRRPSG